MDNKTIEQLIKKSVECRNNAYTPYSNYKVGASLLCKSGNIYSGCNYENVSFGAGVCAERVVIGTAISKGEQDFKAICISGENENITPCGICRQSLYEFGNIDVICCNKKGDKYKVFKLSDLLPDAFNKMK